MHELNDLKRQNISEDSRLLDARQAAKMLGYSVATLYRHHGAKRIPSPLRIGGAVRWDKEAAKIGLPRDVQTKTHGKQSRRHGEGSR